jgi:hypothetical protein
MPVMRKLVVAVTFVALAAAGPAPAKRDRGACERAHSKTIAENRVARVFEREQDADVRSTLHGCLFARDRSVSLATAYDDDYVTAEGYDDVRLRGRYVAWTTFYEDSSCKAACPPDYDATSYSVRVRDLRRPGGRSATTVTPARRLALSRAGAVAWVEDDEVHLLNSAGHEVVATDVQDVSGFRIGVDVLRWTDSAGEHSVPAGEY